VFDIEVVGDFDDWFFYVVMFLSLFVDGEALVYEFDCCGFVVVSGLVCMVSMLEFSYVFVVMGVFTYGNVWIMLLFDFEELDVEVFCVVLLEVVV